MVFKEGGVSHCIQSHHKTEKACTGVGVLRKGIELVKIENGGSSLTFSLCRILFKNTTKKVMIMSAIAIESHHLNRMEIPSTPIFNLYNWIKKSV